VGHFTWSQGSGGYLPGGAEGEAGDDGGEGVLEAELVRAEVLCEQPPKAGDGGEATCAHDNIDLSRLDLRRNERAISARRRIARMIVAIKASIV
jgi:hypothetical protein